MGPGELGEAPGVVRPDPPLRRPQQALNNTLYYDILCYTNNTITILYYVTSYHNTYYSILSCHSGSAGSPARPLLAAITMASFVGPAPRLPGRLARASAGRPRLWPGPWGRGGPAGAPPGAGPEALPRGPPKAPPRGLPQAGRHLPQAPRPARKRPPSIPRAPAGGRRTSRRPPPPRERPAPRPRT